MKWLHLLVPFIAFIYLAAEDDPYAADCQPYNNCNIPCGTKSTSSYSYNCEQEPATLFTNCCCCEYGGYNCLPLRDGRHCDPHPKPPAPPEPPRPPIGGPPASCIQDDCQSICSGAHILWGSCSPLTLGGTQKICGAINPKPSSRFCYCYTDPCWSDLATLKIGPLTDT